MPQSLLTIFKLVACAEMLDPPIIGERSRVWTHVDEPTLGVANAISCAFARFERQYVGGFPDLRRAKKLIIASDYSGDHREASHTAMSFLVTHDSSAEDWARAQLAIRAQYLTDGRRLSYKGLNDRHKHRALFPFLSTANRLSGLIVSVLIDKRLVSIFQRTGKLNVASPDMVDFSDWKSKSVERMLRVTHFASLLLRGLSAPGQDVLWVTDEDEIVANSLRMTKFVSALDNIASHYLTHNLGHFRVATTASDTGTRDVEDMVAIPDIVAGALVDVLPTFAMHGGFRLEGLTLPAISPTKPKARAVMDWFSDNRHPLRRLVCVVNQGKVEKYSVSCVRFHGSAAL